MECGQTPQTLLKLLSSLIRRDSEGNVYLNTKSISKSCDDVPFVDCNNNHLPDEEVVKIAIGEDDCGNPALLIPAMYSDLADVEGEATYDGSIFKWDETDQRFEERDEWDDLRITPGSFDRPGVSDPAYVPYYPNGGGIGVYLPEFGKDDFASFSIQLPHGYKQGSNIFVHLHWTPGARGNEENGSLVGWKIDYTWANINGTFSDMQIANLTDACDGTDHRHQMTPEVEIIGTDKHISSMLLCNVRRADGGADDTWAGSISGELPLLLEVDFHISMDTIGSRTQSSK